MTLPLLDPRATVAELEAILPTIRSFSLLIPSIGPEVVKAEELVAAAIDNPVIGPFLINVYNTAAAHFNAMSGG